MAQSALAMIHNGRRAVPASIQLLLRPAILSLYLTLPRLFPLDCAGLPAPMSYIRSEIRGQNSQNHSNILAVISRVHQIVCDVGLYKQLLGCQGADAQRILDLLQWVCVASPPHKIRGVLIQAG